ncbi:MAG: ABC transporter ATP-binding protein [Deltaproteobacteria bacterium]|nr:ABC transporter ATP-binding protein [Deltaproteobacteria bacterium]
MGAILLENVTKEYRLGNVAVPALRDVSLSIGQGEFTVVAGPSGSGKTTLLNIIGCVDTATSGKVVIEDRDISELQETQLTDLRLRKVGFIFQAFNLISVLNVYDNVEFPLLLRKDISKQERRERVLTFIEKVGLHNHIKHRPNELSGGQRQRVAIARALVTKPAIILADEPTANLDSQTGQTIIELMRAVNESEKTTFVFSTHDQNIIGQARRTIRLQDGHIIH